MTLLQDRTAGVDLIDETLPAFARWLRSAMTARRLGVRQAAKYVGLSASTLSSHMRGESHPDDETIAKYAAYFRVDPHGLFEMLPRPWGAPGGPFGTPPPDPDPIDLLREALAKLERGRRDEPDDLDLNDPELSLMLKEVGRELTAEERESIKPFLRRAIARKKQRDETAEQGA